jgi:hypothetical protein
VPRDGSVVGAGVTPAGGLDAAGGGEAAAGGGAVGALSRVGAGGLLAGAEAFGAGVAAGAGGDGGATGADAGGGAADGAGGCADCAACAGDGAEVAPLVAGATACGGSSAALGTCVGGEFTATQPPAARQHSAIALRGTYRRPIIELPATASVSISTTAKSNVLRQVSRAPSACDYARAWQPGTNAGLRRRGPRISRSASWRAPWPSRPLPRDCGARSSFRARKPALRRPTSLRRPRG